MKTFLRITQVFILAVFFIWLTNTVSAFPINYGFSGTLNYVKTELSSKFSVVDAILGSFSFESTTPDGDSSPTSGIYSNRFDNLSLKVGSVMFGLKDDSFSFIGIKNSDPHSMDYYSFDLLRMSGPTVNSLYPYKFRIYLESPRSPDLIENDLLPVSMPDVNHFSAASFFRVYYKDETNNSIPEFIGLSGRLQTMTASPVPEPSTMLLLGSGLIGLAGYGRRRFLRK